MLIIAIFFIELFTLFILSRFLTTLLFNFFYKTTRNKRISVYLMSFLFLPGTFIHEVSHAFMAVLLQVPVGEMELLPKLIDNNLKLGSVQIAKTDPIRRFLIGTAPFLFGTAILIGTFLYAVQNDLFSYKLSVIVISYLVFEIGNTMFSSKRDMEGALELILTLIFIALVLYFVGFRIPSINPNSLFANALFQQTFQKADLYLAAPIGVNVSLIIILKLLRL